MASSPPTTPTAPSSDDRTPVAPLWHTIVFIIILLGLAFIQARQQFLSGSAWGTMPFHTRLPLYAATLLYELVLLGYVWLLGLRPAGKRLGDLIGGKWARWRDFWSDIGVAFVFWIIVVGVLAALRIVLGHNEAGTRAMKLLLPQGPMEMAVWAVLSVTAGFCEEIVFRGYLQRQFFALTGRAEFAVALQALIFGAAHLYQGVKGAITITIYGALFGALAVVRKSLRPGMIQHAAQDTFSGIVGSVLAKHKYF